MIADCFRKVFQVLVASVAVAVLIPGCAPKTRTGQNARNIEEAVLVIPDFPSAREQYSFAATYQRAMVPSTDRKKRNIQFDKVIQCYERVLKNFPGDQVHAPLSFLAIGDSIAAQGQTARSRAMFQEAISRWPDSDFIQARALFSIARTYDSEGKHQLAQNTYREVIDRFQAKNVPGIPQIVAQAKSRYFRVKEEPTAKLARGSNRFPIFGRLKPLDE